LLSLAGSGYDCGPLFGVNGQAPEQPPLPKGRRANSEAQEEAKSLSPRDRLRQHWLLASTLTCLLLAALVGGTIYWLSVRGYESTDDAFIAARSFAVAPKVGGYVTEVPVTDNQHVNAGDLLARIDDRDYVIAVNQAKAQVAVAEANIGNVQAQIDSQRQQIDQAKAQLEQAEAQLKFAEQEEARAKDLVEKGAGTVQREQQTHSDKQSQQANTSRAKAALAAAEVGVNTLGAQRKRARLA
jgi:membrane fusion protein (multidrug efflux system)